MRSSEPSSRRLSSNLPRCLFGASFAAKAAMRRSPKHGGNVSRNFSRPEVFASEIEANPHLDDALISRGRRCILGRHEYVSESIDLGGGAQIRHV